MDSISQTQLPPFFSTLGLSCIVGITDVFAERFHSANLLSRPFRSILGEVLDAIDGIVPSIFNPIFGAAPAVLDSVRDLFDLADLMRGGISLARFSPRHGDQ